MSKLAIPVVALAVAFAPVASATEQTEIKVELEYDGGALADDVTASGVMESLKEQARDACEVKSALTNVITVDRKCARTLIATAITKIVDERRDQGLVTAPVFESAATIQLSSLEQR